MVQNTQLKRLNVLLSMIFALLLYATDMSGLNSLKIVESIYVKFEKIELTGEISVPRPQKRVKGAESHRYQKPELVTSKVTKSVVLDIITLPMLDDDQYTAGLIQFMNKRKLVASDKVLFALSQEVRVVGLRVNKEIVYVVNDSTIDELIRLINAIQRFKVKTEEIECVKSVEELIAPTSSSVEDVIKFLGEEKVMDYMLKSREEEVVDILKNSDNPNIKTKILKSNLEVFK